MIYPDFFDGKPWDNDAFPPRNDKEKQELQDFFGGVANLGDRLEQLTQLADQLRKEGATFIGTIGFCWVCFLLSSNFTILTEHS